MNILLLWADMVTLWMKFLKRWVRYDNIIYDVKIEISFNFSKTKNTDMIIQGEIENEQPLIIYTTFHSRK